MVAGDVVPLEYEFFIKEPGEVPGINQMCFRGGWQGSRRATEFLAVGAIENYRERAAAGGQRQFTLDRGRHRITVCHLK